MKGFWESNSRFLNASLIERLEGIGSSSHSEFILEKTKSGHWNLFTDDCYFHSKHDPVREANRLAIELPYDNTERMYLFLGAGLGYIILESLKDRPLCAGVWMEASSSILKAALETLDFSEYLSSGRLKILLAPIAEDDLYSAFKGKATVPVTFVPHRASLQWNETEYLRLRYLGENFFHKKDVNLATLVRFEKIWTKNIIQNLSELGRMQPISRIFGQASNTPVLVVGAGPSLSKSIESIQKYREHYIIIAVDTALNVLHENHIEPDLIYSVDPQALNSYYLEGYEGNGFLVFDPTSTYLTPRLAVGPQECFFTSSPFPLTKILDQLSEEEIGNVPFGGSVSTNAFSLAKLLGGSPVYLVAQDLSFTNGLAHAKGAILEERLNWKESRRFRRELHNFQQLTALPKHFEPGIDGSKIQTNEKLIIFRNWFNENAKDAINLTSQGLQIPNLRNSDFESEFEYTKGKDSIALDEINLRKQNVKKARDSIQLIFKQSKSWCNTAELKSTLKKMNLELGLFYPLLEKGCTLSRDIYAGIKSGEKNPKLLSKQIVEMDKIDELVSDKKHLSDILSSSMQRVIFSVTEGFESNLNWEEKENARLGIAKKSKLLYEGLLQTVRDLKKQIAKSILRMGTNESIDLVDH
ncbi:motility associated factor glycosyltransferase family protein [Leptospira sp. GIMC2001]|uniref:motility associated factor glycosyltransferase family protein n=1 Tax=Leptospira sp. GIMC2001 TaxID=1513297 RepID=UPI00234AB570|nr:6-hydroxymethylpterin diphosphokinase MptE-like protein [Leptospira sp. GIMC2001]WCL49321.1 DUF115 domain-containing protein [Leptospira sp. GIMC2001]